MIFMLILLSAESYAYVIMILGYFQTVRPLKRTPVSLPANSDEWPTVDIFVPTYNEPLSVVRYTVWAAMNLIGRPTKFTFAFWTTADANSFASSLSKPDAGT